MKNRTIKLSAAAAIVFLIFIFSLDEPLGGR